MAQRHSSPLHRQAPDITHKEFWERVKVQSADVAGQIAVWDVQHEQLHLVQFNRCVAVDYEIPSGLAPICAQGGPCT